MKSTDPQFLMLLETFMETAKACDPNIIDGAVFMFIPKGGGAGSSSVIAWIPEETDKDDSSVWHDSYLSLVWTLLKSGVDPLGLHGIIDYAADNLSEVDTQNLQSMFTEGEAN